jgi:hypothetical protein
MSGTGDDGACTPGDVKWEKNSDGTFTKYVCEAGRGWVDKGDVQASEVPKSKGGTGQG